MIKDEIFKGWQLLTGYLITQDNGNHELVVIMIKSQYFYIFVLYLFKINFVILETLMYIDVFISLMNHKRKHFIP